MKSELVNQFLLFFLILKFCAKFCPINADIQSKCNRYQNDPQLKINQATFTNYISIIVSPQSSKCSNKTVENESKVVVDSNPLLLWLKDMKMIWKEFPVYKGKESRSNKSPAKQFLRECSNDQVFDLTNGLERIKNRLIGDGILTFNGKKSFCWTKLGIEKVNGSFVNGQLEGMATIHFKNGSFLRAPFSNGIISGLSRVFTCQYGACDFDYQPWTIPNRLSEVSFIFSLVLNVLLLIVSLQSCLR